MLERTAQLESAVKELEADCRRAEETLRQTNGRLQSLSHRLLDIQETERRRLAVELHDELGQALTAAKINLESLQRFPDPAAFASRLNESVAIVDRALQQVRSLSLELRPALLDDLGLTAALRWLADQHAGRSGVSLDFRSALQDARFDAATETACFRVAQEAFTNVARHAGARHVTVDLRVSDGDLHLVVGDDGTGFDVAAARGRAVRGGSLGLLGIEERAMLAGGGVEWRSTPGQGTELHAWFALRPTSGASGATATTPVSPQRVLLADDHALVRAGLRLLLERIPDVEVVGEADDGLAALALIRSLQPDVVLMDIAMRGLSGLAAAARAARECPRVRVVILSMHANEEYVLEALRAGAAGYLLKESAALELDLALKAIGRGEPYLSPAIFRTVIDGYLARVCVSNVRGAPDDLLTPRQREVLTLVAEGKSTKEIAFALKVSAKTVETHRAQIMERIDTHDVAGLVKYAMRVGLIPPGV